MLKLTSALGAPYSLSWRDFHPFSVSAHIYIRLKSRSLGGLDAFYSQPTLTEPFCSDLCLWQNHNVIHVDGLAGPNRLVRRYAGEDGSSAVNVTRCAPVLIGDGLAEQIL